MTARRLTESSLAYRLGQPDDLLACAQIWRDGIDDYERRLGLPELPRDLEPVRRLLAHFASTDPDRFWVATRPADDGRGERIVGFGSALQREHVWFLSMLFVRPEEQAAGLGRRLLEKALPTSSDSFDSERIPVMATATDSVQPISNALYAGYGMVPRQPVFRFVGRPERPDLLPDLPSGVVAVPFDEIAGGLPRGHGHGALVGTVDAIDRALLGYAHPQDHRFLRVEGRVGWLYRGPDGAPLGYGYASAAGRLGPVAVLDQSLVPDVVGHLIRAVEPRGATVVWVPGAADRAFALLLQTGFRLEGFPALLCWNTPFAAFERYLPISLALL